MYFFMEIEDNYIKTIGMSNKIEKNIISQIEYEELSSILDNPPIAPVGKKYKLKLDKTWELMEE